MTVGVVGDHGPEITAEEEGRFRVLVGEGMGVEGQGAQQPSGGSREDLDLPPDEFLLLFCPSSHFCRFPII